MGHSGASEVMLVTEKSVALLALNKLIYDKEFSAALVIYYHYII